MQPTSDRNPQEAPDLIRVGTQSLVDNSRRLGISWGLRPGTVVAPVGGSRTLVVMDGDTATVSAVPLTGQLPAGARVMVLTVPPSALFVLGTLPGEDEPGGRGLVGEVTSQASTGALGAAEVLTGMSFTATFQAGRAYEFVQRLSAFSSIANVVTFRLRETNLAGAVLLGSMIYSGQTSARVMDTSNILVSATDQTLTMVLTVQTSGGTVILVGASTLPRQFAVYDVGPGSDYPNAPTF